MSKADVKSSRPPPLHIPTEVCENIIDMLHSSSRRTRDTFKNVATLHSCALVCRDWRVRSQRRLFYLVQLSNATSFRRLSTILDDAPHLRAYVHEVELTGYHLHSTASIFALFPVVFAGKLPNLSSIDVAHWPSTTKSRIRFSKASDTPNAKALPYIPLHPRFPVLLSSFTAVSELTLYRTTFQTFSQFARMLHSLPSLEDLTCDSVSWISPGGSRYPGADFAKRPPSQWAADRKTLPPLAPRLRKLNLFTVAVYAAQALIWTRGPHMTLLGLTIPLSADESNGPKDPADCGCIDLGPCTGLEALNLLLSPHFSADTHAKCVAEMLASWRPRHVEPVFALMPRREGETTRQKFAEALRGLGTVTEAWLQTLEEQHTADSDDARALRPEKYQLEVEIFDWEAERKWWLDHLDRCFPAWMKSGRLKLSLHTPQHISHEWTSVERLPQANAKPEMVHIASPGKF